MPNGLPEFEVEEGLPEFGDEEFIGEIAAKPVPEIPGQVMEPGEFMMQRGIEPPLTATPAQALAGVANAPFELYRQGYAQALSALDRAMIGLSPKFRYVQPRTPEQAEEFITTPTATILPPTEKGGTVGGAYNAVANAVNSLTSPENLTLLPLMASKTIAQKAAGLLLGQVIMNEPAAIENAITLSKDPEVSDFDKSQAWTEALVVNPEFALLLHGGLRGPIEPPPKFRATFREIQPPEGIRVPETPTPAPVPEPAPVVPERPAPVPKEAPAIPEPKPEGQFLTPTVEVGGKRYYGRTHSEAVGKARAAGEKVPDENESMRKFENFQGELVDRKQAQADFEDYTGKTIDRPEGLHSEDLIEAGMLPKEAAPEAAPTAEAEPAVPEGSVRVYHSEGGAGGAGLGGAHAAESQAYSATFGPDQFYVDVPKSEFEAMKAEARSRGKPADLILSKERVKQLSPVAKPIEPPTHVLEPEPEPAKPTGKKSVPYSEPDLARYRDIYKREKELRQQGIFLTPEGDFTPEYEALQSEFEKLRNKYGGMPPAQGTGLPPGEFEAWKKASELSGKTIQELMASLTPEDIKAIEAKRGPMEDTVRRILKGVESPESRQLTTETKLFHGSYKGGITSLTPSKSGDFGRGVYLTTNFEFAKGAASGEIFDISPEQRAKRAGGEVYDISLKSNPKRVWRSDETPLTSDELDYWRSTEEGIEDYVKTRNDLAEARTGRNYGSWERTELKFNSEDWDGFFDKFGYDAAIIGDEVVIRNPDLLSTPKQYKPEMAGMGGMAKGEELKPELAQLTDAMRTMAEGQKRPQLRRAYTLGEKFEKAKVPVLQAVNGLKVASKHVWTKLSQPPEWNTFKSSLGDRQVALSESVLNAKDFVDKSLRAVPKALDREAITNWIEHNGDKAKLLDALVNTKPQYKRGYQRARTLPAELRTIAENIKNYFDSRLQDAIDAGVLEDGVEDYIHRMYEADDPWKAGVISELRSGVFTGRPAFAKERVFQYDYEAEQAGRKPVKDFARRVAAYDLSLNKSIADRKFVKDMMAWKMKDGQKAIVPAGIGIKVGPADQPDSFLVKPQVKGKQAMTADGRPYVAFDHPALRKWKWIGEGPDGSPALIQGNALVHPDALAQVKAVFGRSKLRQYKFVRGLQKVSSTVKQTMLDLSGFHMVQITVHGWEHRTFRPVNELDLTNPEQRSLVKGGLQVADHHGSELFSEGLYGTSLTQHIPFFGDKLTAFKEYLFQDYIPRLKMAMALHALDRNRVRFAADLKSGKMSEEQLFHLTANQGNAAFGELNYEMMGRNPTTQDVLRLTLLAPDFLEARGRFAGQAMTKYGREQTAALLLGAGVMYVTARILNKLLTDQYHFESRNAFSVVYKNRAYSLRTVQGDLLHMITSPQKFAYSRLNPVYGRTTFEAITQRDPFGRKRTALEQVKDLSKTIIPISLRGLVDKREQNLFESFLNSIGITERRDTANDEVYRMAEDYKKKKGIGQPGEFIYDPEKDPYRRIKLALVFDTPQAAAQEMKLAVDDKKLTPLQIQHYFQRYGRTPFTGSKVNDRDFYTGLSEDQKKIFDQAMKERRTLHENALRAQQLFHQDFTGPAPAQTPKETEAEGLPTF